MNEKQHQGQRFILHYPPEAELALQVTITNQGKGTEIRPKKKKKKKNPLGFPHRNLDFFFVGFVLFLGHTWQQ